MTGRVLVTGANGFVGRVVCAQLMAAGWAVRAGVRRTEAIAALPVGVEPLIVPPAGGAGDWVPALRGTDAVVHLVARTHVLRDRASDPLAAYRRINVDGTRQLLAASSTTGVRRFVYMSSIKAVGEGNDNLPYTEAAACEPEDAYGISKLEAEGLVLAAARDGVEPVVLRPPLVYGPGVQGNFLRLLEAVSRGIPLPLGSVNNARSMISVANLASVVQFGLEKPGATGEVFHVTDDTTLSTPQLISRLADLMHRPVRLLPVPVSLLRVGGRLLGRAGEVNRLVSSLTVSSAKARHVLGWVAPQSVEEGLRDTVTWFRATVAGSGGHAT
jgi:nucleoside-diphosphate-sugar epimerase